MNMSDDIAGAVINVSAKTVGEAAHATRTIIEALIRLMRILEESKRRVDVHNQEINDIKSGKISTKALIEHCRQNHEQIVFSEQGMSKHDASILASRAKKCGIPIAFHKENGKDNIYASIRQSDLAVYKQLTTELIKEKLQIRPQELSNFKCREWEIPFINAELKKYDLSAQFAATNNGDYIAIYESSDAKAIEIARSEFVRKANEIENSIEFSRDKDGFYNITDKISGKTFPFDDTPNRTFISRQLQKQFGYDDNKANIAAQKFGKEMLSGEIKEKYFSDDPTAEFSYISKVSWDNEDLLVKNYDCYFVTPKEDGVARVVYQDNDGNFAVLNPPRMTKLHMRSILENELGIKDHHEQDALIAKAEHVSSVNSRYRSIMGVNTDLHKHDVTFEKSAFDMKDTAIVSGMRRTDDNGNTYTKSQPLDSISTSIARKDLNTFEIDSTAIVTETDQNGLSQSVPNTHHLVLSFSNKKSALHELQEMYQKQGVPEAAAKDIAKNVYKKAELQNASPIIAIEKTKDTTVMFTNGNKKIEISTVDRNGAIEALSEEYGIPKEDASVIMEKADDIIVTSSSTEVKVDTNINELAIDSYKNGHELHPEGNILSDSADKVSSTLDKTVDTIDDISEGIEEVASRGGR